MNKSMKIIFFGLLFLLMLGTTIWASLQQNLFTEFSLSGSPMWFTATLVDFYINQFILWLWVVWVEKSNLLKAIWLVVFVCLGSMGTCAYIMIKIYQNKNLFQKEGL